jgi:bifunctional non-homologous end joining protein LigD
MILEGVNLACCVAGHDAVYNLWIEKNDLTAQYEVHCEYGKRGSTLTHGTLIGTSNLAEAKQVYQKTIIKKTSGGRDRVYVIMGAIPGTPGPVGSTGPVGAIPIGAPTLKIPGLAAIPATVVPPPMPASASRVSNPDALPMLLNKVPREDLALFMEDHRWVMQEKFDGRHQIYQMLGGKVKAWNKIGKEIEPYSKYCSVLQSAFADYDFTIDGEACGDIFWAFDILFLEGHALRSKTYEERLMDLGMLMRSVAKQPVIMMASTAYTKNDKQRLIDDVVGHDREGVVIKKLSAVYQAGRPSSGGPALKCPFVEHATCQVIKRNDKRSVEVGVLIPGSIRSMGNVSIPVNHEIPEPGDIVEVQYLYAHKGGDFHIAVYKGKCDDAEVDPYTSLKFKPEP